MFEPRTLTVDANESRARRTKMIFGFMDLTPTIAQVSELLRQASLRRLDDHAHANHPNDGPTGLSIAVRWTRRMIEQVAGFDAMVLVLGVSSTGSATSCR